MSSVSKNSALLSIVSSYTKQEVITAALNTAVELNLPIAIWRMPQQSELRLIISANAVKRLDNIDLEELPKGFVTAPFHYGQEPAYFIDADLCLSFDFEEIVDESEEENEETGNLAELKAHFEHLLDKGSHTAKHHINTNPANVSTRDYRTLVQESVTAIENGHFDKVVPARSKSISLSEGFNSVELLLDLCETYSNAFVSFVSIPKVGTWLGASPEVLIEKSDKVFKTIALAGTQRFEEAKHISDTSWTQKEIEEQAMVSRYIINCFKKIRLREFKEVGPKTVKAGNLLHLKTSYAVNTQETNFPELATVMLNLLHPTSAVAGMPKEPAMEFLLDSEGLNRGFFSGFLGPVSIENNTNLFVNLRCMEVLENAATLYAGAGVTSDSQPEKEYQETEMKFKTLLNIINKQL